MAHLALQSAKNIAKQKRSGLWKQQQCATSNTIRCVWVILGIADALLDVCSYNAENLLLCVLIVRLRGCSSILQVHKGADSRATAHICAVQASSKGIEQGQQACERKTAGGQRFGFV